jgi:hypothetical protein
MYKLTNTANILRTADNAFIPPDTANTDYQAYLAWVEAGNAPEPADAIDPWIAIKAERDQRKAGGWKVGDNWFHSDEPSRTQYGTLLTTAIEKALPADYVFNQYWKTMSGAFVPMTVALVRQIRDVGLATESDLFAAAERMRAGDTTAVWPAIYGG